MNEDERAFTRACQDAIAESKALGYNPTYWIRMIEEHGAVQAARRLIHDDKLHEGLLRLLSLGRSDLTVEEAVTNPRWDGLFNSEDQAAARGRLDDAERLR